MRKFKTCSKCGETKHTSEFYAKRGSCKRCDSRRRSRGAAPKVQPKVEVVPETITHVEEHRLKRMVSHLKAEVKDLTAQLSDAQMLADIAAEARLESVEPIEPRERRPGILREATALVCASDWHIEEEVRPEQVAGRNRYNLEISERRMQRFFESARWATDFSRQIFTIRDMVLWLGGDLITNYLHPDNVETNLLSPPQAIAYAHSSIVAGIRFLLKDKKLARLVVVCNDGNHGRMSDKMRSAARTAQSIEWLLYHMIAHDFRDDKRVEFIIAEGEHLYFDVYGRTIRFTHGDSTRYGGGIGGIMIPIYKAISRWQTVQHADLTVMGHYHQRTVLPDLIVNGCFESGTRVVTPDGVRPIETIQIGDRVLSRDGTIQVVENTMTKDADDLIRLRVKGLPNQLVCTPNHEIWAIKGESSNLERPSRINPRAQTTILQERPDWYRAEHLSEGDWIHTPHLKGTREMDHDLLFAYGVFMAEGHTVVDGGATERHNRIEYSMHIDELDILERIKKTLDRELGREGRIWTRPERTTSHLSYSGKDVAEHFRKEFGHKAVGKRVPSWMFELSPDCRQAVVEGWIEGDGHRGKCVTATTISEQLAWGMYLLALGTEYEPMLYGEGVRKLRQGVYTSAFRVSFVKGQDVRWVNGERFVRVDLRRREYRATVVHDLQVSGEHTYCVEGLGVHNSLIGYSPYSLTIGARFEAPSQNFSILEPQRFRSLDLPLWVSERDDDIAA